MTASKRSRPDVGRPGRVGSAIRAGYFDSSSGRILPQRGAALVAVQRDAIRQGVTVAATGDAYVVTTSVGRFTLATLAEVRRLLNKCMSTVPGAAAVQLHLELDL